MGRFRNTIFNPAKHDKVRRYVQGLAMFENVQNTFKCSKLRYKRHIEVISICLKIRPWLKYLYQIYFVCEVVQNVQTFENTKETLIYRM